MKPSLQLRLSQQLSLTPQLQQSIRLLQLSTLELHQELEQMLADNPLLERLDDPLDRSVRLLADGALPTGSSTSLATGSENDADAPAIEFDSPEEGHDSYEQTDSLDWGGSANQNNSRSEDDESSLQHIEAHAETLREHLLAQLRATQCGARDCALVGLLIDSLDENGFLEQDLATLLAALPIELEIEIEELSAALALLKSFEPTGVGASNMRECLGLQLQALNLKGVAHRTKMLAATLLENHLQDLAERDYAYLRKALQCEDEDLRAAQDLIRTLNPRPGNAFLRVDQNYVVPDVVVRKVKGQWLAMLNQEVMPRLRVNPDYASTLRGLRTRARNKVDQAAALESAAPQVPTSAPIPTGIPMQAQLQEARWYIKNVQQRFETILRVAQAIVDRQKNFFSHGAVGMRPLVLREIADTLGLHESTISRVTTQKYMLTPFGTFELKYFFGSHIATDSGGAASSTAIRALIKQLIGAENPKKPLSDSQIADLLGEQGFVVARRTVAKYREALKIQPVSMRKNI